MQSSGKINKNKDMINQETKPVKTQGGFNLTILKVKNKSTRKNRSFTIATQTTNILLLPTSRNLLTRPRANSETTDSFFFWPLQNTNTHICNFEIPLNGLGTQTLMFVTPRPLLKVQIISTFDDQRRQQLLQCRILRFFK